MQATGSKMVVATYSEAMSEYARNAGVDDPEREWILTPWDTWHRNPTYTGPRGPHPEDDYELGGYEDGDFCDWPYVARVYDDIPF